MASYPELKSLFSNSDLQDRAEVACIIAAQTIKEEDGATANHANRLVWAKEAFSSPKAMASKMLMAILAANEGLSVSAITGATDSALQSNVDAVVDIFADGS